MQVLWAARALRDLDRLHDFLVEKDIEVADRAIGAVLDAAGRLADFPRLGKVLPDGKRREWPVSFASGAYVIRYRVSKSQVLVVRVWHSREDR